MRLQWHAGKSARVERGFRVPVPAEVDRLAELYKIPTADRQALRALAAAARKRAPASRVADFAQTYLAMEREASTIRFFDSVLIHGLAQTSGYARAMLERASDADVDRRVEERIARQRILDAARPPTLRILLGEAALHQLVGGREVMVEQLTHLLKLMERPNVDIRIIPFATGAHRGLGVSFSHLALDAPISTARVYIEGLTDATYLHDPAEVAEYAAAFDVLWSTTALGAAESATILRTRIDITGGSNGRDTLA